MTLVLVLTTGLALFFGGFAVGAVWWADDEMTPEDKRRIRREIDEWKHGK